MELEPISLVAVRGNYSRFRSRKRNKAFHRLEKETLDRDNKTCQYCGFYSEEYQTVVNHNNNYQNNQPENLKTACLFCAHCFFLDGIGKDDVSGGTIIYLPEISQADLNHFCRALFASLLRNVPYKGKLHATYLSLKERSKVVESVFGPETSKVVQFGQALIDSNVSPEKLYHPIFEHLRFLPNRKYYSKPIQYWKSTVFAELPL